MSIFPKLYSINKYYPKYSQVGIYNVSYSKKFKGQFSKYKYLRTVPFKFITNIIVIELLIIDEFYYSVMTSNLTLGLNNLNEVKIAPIIHIIAAVIYTVFIP